MRPLLRAFLAVGVLVLTTASPSGAVVHGETDNVHRYVGILVAVDGGDRTPVCSGFLIRPKVFVTAAHCTAFLGSDSPAFVSFDQGFTDSSRLRHGKAVLNPAYDPDALNTNDLSVVVLDKPVRNRGFAELPQPGIVDKLNRSDDDELGSLTIVGYGANEVFPTHPPTYDFQLTRTMGPTELLKLPKHRQGGRDMKISSEVAAMCFGDSGGPLLLGETDVAVGISSYVTSRRCAKAGFGYRLDTPESLGFLAPYL